MCVVNDGVLSQVSVMCACVYVILALAYTARSVTLRQVRRPLVRPKSIPSPTELEAPLFVCTSTPLVPLDSAPSRRGNRSDCLVVAQACLLVVHYTGREKTAFYRWSEAIGRSVDDLTGTAGGEVNENFHLAHVWETKVCS